MPRELDFCSTLTTLWFRLITIGIVGLVFAEALVLGSGKAQGWTFYLTSAEVAFEVVVRLIFTALVGIVLGTICTSAIAPFLWFFKSWRERIAEVVTQVAVVVVVFLDTWFGLTTLITWSYHWRGHRKIFDTLLLAAYFLAFGAALCIESITCEMGKITGHPAGRRTAEVRTGSSVDYDSGLPISQ